MWKFINRSATNILPEINFTETERTKHSKCSGWSKDSHLATLISNKILELEVHRKKYKFSHGVEEEQVYQKHVLSNLRLVTKSWLREVPEEGATYASWSLCGKN